VALSALDRLSKLKNAPIAREQLAALQADPAVVEATSRVAATAASPVVQQIADLATHPDVLAAIDLSSHPGASIPGHAAQLALADAMQSSVVQQYQALTSSPQALAHVAALSSPVLAALADAHDAAGITPPAVLTTVTRATPTRTAGSTRSAKDQKMVAAATPTGKIMPMQATVNGVLASATFEVRVTPQVDRFKPTRFCVDPDVAKYFRITDIKIGNQSQLAGSGELPASMFDPRVLNEYSFDVCPAGTFIVITGRNADSAGPHDFACGIAGEEHSNG
jgi:hypothetical protein